MDAETYSERANKLRKNLRHYARGLGLDRDTADDVVAEAIETRYVGLDQYIESRCSLYTWLCLAVQRCAVNEKRRNTHGDQTRDPMDVWEPRTPAQRVVDPHSDPATLEVGIDVRGAIASLPLKEHRMLASSILLHGRTFQEVADAWAEPVQKVKDRYAYHVLRPLRQYLTAYAREARP